jgi:hypothetical protein
MTLHSSYAPRIPRRAGHGEMRAASAADGTP